MTGPSNRRARLLVWLTLGAILISLLGCVEPAGGRQVVLGCGESVEQQVLCELSRQIIEQQGIRVEVREHLGEPWMVRSALMAHSIDLCWEYTGVAWHNYLKHHQPIASSSELFQRVYREDLLNDLTWLAYTPAEERLGVWMLYPTAGELRINSMSALGYHLANIDPYLVMATTQEHLEDDFGPSGMSRIYQASFKDANLRVIDIESAFDALGEGTVHCVLARSSEIPQSTLPLYRLPDDRAYFPASNLAPVASSVVVRDHPDVVTALRKLTDSLDQATLRQLVSEGSKSPARAARRFLRQNDILATPTQTPTKTATPTMTAISTPTADD